MNNIYKMLRILYFLVFSCINIAYAEIESGFYLNPSVGYGYLSNNTRYNTTNNTSVNLGLMGGYAFNKYLAIDAGVNFMPNTSPTQTTNYYLTDVAVRGSVPLSGFVSAYLHVGVGGLFNSSPLPPSQIGIFTGLGAIFDINKYLGITVEDYGIFVPSSASYDINVLALGLLIKF